MFKFFRSGYGITLEWNSIAIVFRIDLRNRCQFLKHRQVDESVGKQQSSRGGDEVTGFETGLRSTEGACISELSSKIQRTCKGEYLAQCRILNSEADPGWYSLCARTPFRFAGDSRKIRRLD